MCFLFPLRFDCSRLVGTQRRRVSILAHRNFKFLLRLLYSPPILGGVVADRGGYYMFFLIFFFTPSELCLTPSKLLLLGITQASLALHSLIRNFRPPKTGGQYRAAIFCAIFY